MTRGVTLLAFDFDGTLAAIEEDPGMVRIDPEAAEFLQEAASVRGMVVAVISGRDADDLAARTNATGAFLVGSHGLEIRAPGGAVLRDAAPVNESPDEALLAHMAAAGLRLERKKHGLALHWRNVPGMEGSDDLVERFRGWARAAGLDLIEGRCVVEARRHGSGKEEALRWLASTTAASRVIYSGDDVTDLGALRFASEHGRALFIASDERVPPDFATVVRSIADLFPILRSEMLL